MRFLVPFFFFVVKTGRIEKGVFVTSWLNKTRLLIMFRRVA